MLSIVRDDSNNLYWNAMMAVRVYPRQPGSATEPQLPGSKLPVKFITNLVKD